MGRSAHELTRWQVPTKIVAKLFVRRLVTTRDELVRIYGRENVRWDRKSKSWKVPGGAVQIRVPIVIINEEQDVHANPDANQGGAHAE